MADFSEWSPEISGTTSPPQAPPPEGVPSFADRTHTVSASATGGGTGTDANPWTLAEACQFCQPGMIIGLRAGVYIGTDPLPGEPPETERARLGGFNLTTSGTAEERIYFVAENFAALETDTARMSWIRSGATLVGRGWVAVSIRASYVSLIGIYYSDVGVNDSHAKIQSGRIFVTGGDNTDVHIAYCRFYKGSTHSDWEKAQGLKTDNDGSIRIERSPRVFITDCHFEATWQGYVVNSPHILIYYASYTFINNNYFSRGNTCVFAKRGFWGDNLTASPLIIRFNNNHTKSVSEQLRYAGIRDEAIATGNEDDRNWIYCNVFEAPKEGGPTFGSDNFTYLCHNGIRIFNNVVGGVTTIDYGSMDWGPVSGFSLYDNAYSPPDRNNMSFNNIFLQTLAYYKPGNPNSSEPRDLAWVNAFFKTQRNLVEGYTQLFRGRPPLDTATWADLQASGGETDSLQGVSPNLDADFRPQTGSPAIGLGRDLLGAFGPVNGVVDAGCYPTGDEVIGIRR